MRSFSPFIDHLVAVDGSYASLKAEKVTSHVAQYGAVMQACQEAGIGFTVHQQPQAWEGDEVEKRTFMFSLGEAVTEADDWFCVIDADEFVEEYPDDLRERLENASENAVIVLFSNPGKADQHVRIFFRGRGIHCQTNHYTFVTGDGKVLWGNEFDNTPVEPVLDLRDEFKVLHLTAVRDKERSKKQWDYYRHRDKKGLEMGQCKRCTRNAVRLSPFNLKPVFMDYPLPDGTVLKNHKFLAGSYIELCEKCGAKQKKRNDHAFRLEGFEPDDPNLRQYAAPNDVANTVREQLE